MPDRYPFHKEDARQFLTRRRKERAAQARVEICKLLDSCCTCQRPTAETTDVRAGRSAFS